MVTGAPPPPLPLILSNENIYTEIPMLTAELSMVSITLRGVGRCVCVCVWGGGG